MKYIVHTPLGKKGEFVQLFTNEGFFESTDKVVFIESGVVEVPYVEVVPEDLKS